jgi:hypothetical protein
MLAGVVFNTYVNVIQTMEVSVKELSRGVPSSREGDRHPSGPEC